MNRAFRAIPYLLLALTPSAFLQASFASTPVGAVKLTIKGNGGSGAAVTYLSVPFHQGDSFVGTVTGVGTGSLSCSSATWTSNAYANAYYVEITSGANAGVAATIAANTATTLTLAEDLSAFSPNTQTFAIRKYTTLADVFGASNSAGLQGGANIGAADEILIPNPETQSFDIYFYKNSGLGTIGWRKSGDNITNRSSTIIPPGSGIIIKRKQLADITIYTSGTVLDSQSLTPVFPSVNYISSQFPLPATLSNLFGPTANNLIKGASSTNSDEILVPNNSNGFDVYYYRVGTGLLGTGWRKNGSGSTDQANTVIAQPGGVYIIKRKSTAFNLTQNKPY